MTGEVARTAAERAAREACGRLVARLARRARDIAAAEDALSEAFAAALRVWPERGTPESPEAWLLTTARRALGREARKTAARAAAAPDIVLLVEEAAERAAAGESADERFSLMFVCAHPAIEETIRTPLMLQAVLGLDAERIAAAFVASPTAMAQRLVRAKRKIRDAGLSFERADDAQARSRMGDVLAAVYAAYGAGWDRAGPALDPCGLAEEALYLARLCVADAPDDPEALGLLALILYSSARSAARRDAAGAFVPLARQNRRLWRGDRIAEAERVLTRADERASRALRRPRRARRRDRRGGRPRRRVRLAPLAAGGPAPARRPPVGTGRDVPTLLGGAVRSAARRGRRPGRPARGGEGRGAGGRSGGRRLPARAHSRRRLTGLRLMTPPSERE